VNKVISIELGYDHVIDYIETRGWTITRKSRNQPGYTLQYRKLEAAIAARPSDKQSATKTRNLHAMVEDLFCRIQSDALNDPYSGAAGLRFLDKESFKAKLNSHAQDLQGALMITKHLFLDHVPYHDPNPKKDLSQWTLKIFRDCHDQKEFILFCNNILSLIPNEGNPDLCCSLFRDHSNSLKDQVHHLADAEAHHIKYSQQLRATLGNTFRRVPNKNGGTSLERSIIMLRCCMNDLSMAWLPEAEKQLHQSLTRKKGKSRKKSSKCSIETGKLFGCAISCVTPDIQ
jgi:hypothetical protein